MNERITNNNLQTTTMKGEFYAISSKSAVALRSAAASGHHLNEFLSEQEKLITRNSLFKTISQPKADEPLAQKRSNTMKHPEVLAGGRNAQQKINSNDSNNKIQKRSKVMNATTLFSRGLITLISILFLVGITFGQNLILSGSGASTYNGTWKVKGNIDNTSAGGANTFTGVVELKGASDQAIGVATKPDINFATLKATGTSPKTFQVNSDISSNLDATAAGTTQFITNGTKLTLQGTITNTGLGTTPYDFHNSGSEVIYVYTGAQTVWSGITYYNLTIGTGSTSGTKSMNGDVTVASALAVKDGDLSIGASTLTVNGTYPTGTTAVTGGSSSNLILNGSGAITSFAVTNGLNNFTLGRSNIIVLSSNLTLAGTAALTSGGTLAIGSLQLTLTGANTVISGAGSLTSNSDGTVYYNNSSSNQNVYAFNYGNLKFDGNNKTFPSGTVGIAGNLLPGTASFTITQGTVDFNGTGAQTIPQFTFNNLSTSNTGDRTASGNITVASTLTNGNGGSGHVLYMGSNALTFGTAVNTGATIAFAGTNNGIALNSGTIEYNGDHNTLQTIAAGTYYNLTLASGDAVAGAAKQIASGATVTTTQSMTVPALTSLTLVDAGSTLTVGGDLNVSGPVTNNGTINVGE